MRSQSILSLVLTCLALVGCTSSSDDGDATDQGSDVAAPQSNDDGDGGTVTMTGDDPMDMVGDGDGDASGDGGVDGAAGTSGGDGDAGGTTVPLSELPAAFAGAICDALEACVGPAVLGQLMEREDCSGRITKELQATDFAHMDAAIAAGRVLYDPTKLEECTTGIRAMECDVIAYSYPQACVDVLQGNVAIDGECVISAECAGTAFCGGDGSCPSTCTALLDEGDACSGDSQCGDGLRCIGGQCAPPSKTGGDCGGDSGKVCALGFNCMGATDVAVGTCVPNADVQVGEVGEACEPGGLLCEDGLSCVFDGASSFTCEEKVGPGEECNLGLPGQCPVDEYCDTTLGTCQPWPVDGELCVLSGDCAAGHACVPEGSEATCRAMQDNGGSCGADALCRSGNCVGGACMPPPACI